MLDNQPRVLDPLQRDALRILADQVMTQLDLRAVIANETVLRSEIDHRVKNSLQMVGAFVSLEQRASDNEQGRASLQRVARQINIVAALHEHLGMAATDELIQLGPYLDQVVRLINPTLAADVSVQGSFENVAVGRAGSIDRCHHRQRTRGQRVEAFIQTVVWNYLLERQARV
ncbi:MAG: histidine kinase dimerization/phosphoacceptor domain -containing protein [Nitrobacter sp.]